MNSRSALVRWLGALTLSACLVPLVAAQPPGGGWGPGGGMGWQAPAFTEFDLDGNGVLTETEFYQARAQRIAERSQQGYAMRGLSNAPEFSAIDRNGDGQVDATEFATAQAQHRQQRFQTP
ncbi:EF-hand domain-containing protein [Allochromatium vinosum]|uniref:EF-hand domain-containing protein n=1 Tax=Allochromatium vinosum (strain ATCC 17899 / DSM 180 / NBRC 103801 / NCIMB 10441 / D) TaxID=572477 RepID=D3RPJ9_ALLVD|nr:EF-hand domain-containing protein [Allochromatium vinosum]ADC61581.1 hypothetical protein Alvin_0631 [Allochromatium vinosum DSM 180]